MLLLLLLLLPMLLMLMVGGGGHEGVDVGISVGAAAARWKHSVHKSIVVLFIVDLVPWHKASGYANMHRLTEFRSSCGEQRLYNA